MAKTKITYVCKNCGSVYPRWAGKCDSCNQWNCIEQQTETAVFLSPRKGAQSKHQVVFSGLKGAAHHTPRIVSHIKEFDRVCGGGLVDGMITLIGGDPGIGKSTLLLQIAACICAKQKTAYISGEESLDQIRLRAGRLGVEKSDVMLASCTDISHILATLRSADAPKVLVIDSIQTMFLDTIDSAPGTVAQVRACAYELIRCAKIHNICLLIIGHVTKDGTIAGPRVLEHMVDTVLYFEGERTHHYRILRSVKNRFGATDEIGVFEMTQRGLQEVLDPSAMFLANHNDRVAGSAIFAGIEGSRPMLVEIQALIAPSTYSTPKRSVVGWDSNRLSMILAVIESRAGLKIVNNDIYINVAGGLKISEPAADMAIVAALISLSLHKPLPKNSLYFGEIGLNGELRASTQTQTRLKEASKLGFTTAFIPKQNKKLPIKTVKNITEIQNVIHLVESLTEA